MVKGEHKTKAQLLEEPARLHQHIADLETSQDDRKQTSEALRQAHAEVEQLFNAAVPLCAVSTEHNILRVNDAFCSFFGLAREEIVGAKCDEVWRGPVCNTPECPMVKIQSGAEQAEYELDRHFPDGRTVSCVVTAVPYLGPDGELIGIVKNFTDITERKRAEDERENLLHDLRERVKELRCLYGLADTLRKRKTLEEVFEDVVALIPPAWHYPEIARVRIRFDGREYVSRAFKETRWKQSSDIIVGGRRRGVVEVFYLQQRPESAEGPFLAEERDLIDTVARALSEGAEHKLAEEELSLYREHLEQLVEERTVELAAANKELEAFAYSVSHDLRSPLRGMDGFSAALLEEYGDRLDEQGRDYLARARAAAGRMGDLIDDLLGLSRISRVEMEHETVDLSALAEKIAAGLQKKDADRRATFEIAGGLTALGDRKLLRIALEKLIDNAWKFTSRHPKARIEFGVADVDNEATFFVRDDGAGFDMAYAHKLFGPFQRLHSLEEFPGTGIGLATAQRIIHRHGGRIWARAEVEKGATFYFTLPQTPRA